MKQPTFSPKENFFNILSEHVKEYLSKDPHTKYADWRFYFKNVFFLFMTMFVYCLLLSTLPVWLALILCGLLGFLFACIGFNLMHDGAHGSVSGKNFWNTLAGYSLNLMGCSVIHWKSKHNHFHHTYTNVNDYDDDIYILPVIRTNIYQPGKRFHRFQHLYAPFAYTLTYFLWVWVQDFQKYFRKKVGTKEIPSGQVKMDIKDHVIFWMTKVSHFFFFLVLPSMIHGVIATIAGYVVFVSVCGLFISIVFQLAHVVSNVDFEPIPNGDSKLKSFSVHQLSTTSDFAVKSSVARFLFGGLNFQVEHHLFPKISHRHYPAIQKIVEKVAREQNITYHSFPTFWSAVKDHFAYLKKVGSAPTLS